MELTSSAYEDGGRIPAEHANTGVPGGRNVSVPLEWTAPPEHARSIAVAMVDRHPVARDWVHWLVIDVPPAAASLPAGASGTDRMPPGSRELPGTGARMGYRDGQGYEGPQPPPGTGDHAYETTVYALDVDALDLPDGATLARFEEAIRGHVVAKALVTGMFGR